MCSIPSRYGMMIAVVNCCDFQIPLVEYVNFMLCRYRRDDECERKINCRQDCAKMSLALDEIVYHIHINEDVECCV